MVPSWFPPGPEFDRFGLPLNWSLLGETEDQRIDRMASVIGAVGELYTVAVRHLGKQFAREVWKAAAKGRPGRPKGRKDPERDELLLKMYDRFVSGKDEKARKSVPRELAEFVKCKGADLFPATTGAIEQRIRRLLKAREQDRVMRSEADRGLAATMLAKNSRSA